MTLGHDPVLREVEDGLPAAEEAYQQAWREFQRRIQDAHYIYAANSPCNYIDPTGTSFRCAVAGAAAGFLGATVGGGIGLAFGAAFAGFGLAAGGLTASAFVKGYCESGASTRRGKVLDGVANIRDDAIQTLGIAAATALFGALLAA